MKRIAIFFTGGTIAMRQGEDGAVRPALGLGALLAELPLRLPDAVELLPVEWANLPSSHMTPELMFQVIPKTRQNGKHGVS